MTTKPTHTAYVVIDAKDKDGKAIWFRVGAIFVHKNGDGFDLAIPNGINLSGRIVCRKPREAEDEGDTLL